MLCHSKDLCKLPAFETKDPVWRTFIHHDALATPQINVDIYSDPCSCASPSFILITGSFEIREEAVSPTSYWYEIRHSDEAECMP